MVQGVANGPSDICTPGTAMICWESRAGAVSLQIGPDRDLTTEATSGAPLLGMLLQRLQLTRMQHLRMREFGNWESVTVLAEVGSDLVYRAVGPVAQSNSAHFIYFDLIHSCHATRTNQRPRAKAPREVPGITSSPSEQRDLKQL